MITVYASNRSMKWSTRLMLALALLAMARLTSAAEWVPVARNSRGTVYSVDKSSITVVSATDKIVSAWDKGTLRFPESWGHPGGRMFDNFQRFTTHFCREHRAEVGELKIYDHEWMLAQTTEPPSWLATPLEINPGSVGEAIHKAVCDADEKN